MTVQTPNKFEYGFALGLSVIDEMTVRERRACGISDKNHRTLMTQRYITNRNPALGGSASDHLALFEYEEKKAGKNYTQHTQYSFSPDLETAPAERAAEFGIHEASHSLRWKQLRGMQSIKAQKNVIGAAFGFGFLYNVMANEVAFNTAEFAKTVATYTAAGVLAYQGLRRGIRLYDESLAYKLQGVVRYALDPHKLSLDEIKEERKELKAGLSPWQKAKDLFNGYPSPAMAQLFILNGYEQAARHTSFDDARLKNVYASTADNLRTGKFIIGRIKQ